MPYDERVGPGRAGRLTPTVRQFLDNYSFISQKSKIQYKDNKCLVLQKKKNKKFREKVEKQLNDVGLGKVQIENYTLPELEQYLITVNKLIANPEGLSTIELEFSIIGVKSVSLE